MDFQRRVSSATKISNRNRISSCFFFFVFFFCRKPASTTTQRTGPWPPERYVQASRHTLMLRGTPRPVRPGLELGSMNVYGNVRQPRIKLSLLFRRSMAASHSRILATKLACSSRASPSCTVPHQDLAVFTMCGRCHDTCSLNFNLRYTVNYIYTEIPKP